MDTAHLISWGVILFCLFLAVVAWWLVSRR
jgi:cbb3-type cytochrome oxidase subunit 3